MTVIVDEFLETDDREKNVNFNALLKGSMI